MSPGDIQRALTDFYRIDIPHSVEDFLCDREVAEAASGQDPSDRGEVLLIAQDDDAEDVHVGLYLCDHALQELASGGDAWGDGRAHYASLATEGVSHFLYVMYRAERDQSLSQLELELQGEVDKYAAATALFAPQQVMQGFGVGFVRSLEMRRRLFAEAQFLDDAASEEGHRYRKASRLAAKFTQALEQRHLRRGDIAGWRAALRAFYRQSFREKLETVG